MRKSTEFDDIHHAIKNDDTGALASARHQIEGAVEKAITSLQDPRKLLGFTLVIMHDAEDGKHAQLETFSGSLASATQSVAIAEQLALVAEKTLTAVSDGIKGRK